FWLFGLDMPPMGYEWVRHGPDALLINTGNGEIVQVVYGRFF
ncbi:TPA: RcnB family protein, partial [Stenotrophomonas maltophilia]|nr:RcnB family protein [Stenotrophomonas maltophilia]